MGLLYDEWAGLTIAKLDRVFSIVCHVGFTTKKFLITSALIGTATNDVKTVPFRSDEKLVFNITVKDGGVSGFVLH